jgi:Na+-driven multidrug efflux pump
MIGLTAGGFLNLLGDPFFIFICHMGVAGAGISTFLSQIISFLLLLIMFFVGKTQSRLSFRYVTKRPNDMWIIVNTGMASLIRQGLNSVATMLLNHQAAVYGDAAVAGMSIVNRVTFFVFAVGLGIGQGFQPVSAFNYGAGKYSRVKKGFYFTVFMGDVALGVLALFVIIFTPEIVRFFRDDPAVIRVSVFALRCQCLACMAQPYFVCTNMMFQSIGKAGRASFLSALRSGIFFIPLILILPRCLGLLGVQVSQSISDTLSFILSFPFAISFLHQLPPDQEAQSNMLHKQHPPI